MKNSTEQEKLSNELKLWKIITVEKNNQILIIRIRIKKPYYQDINLYKEAVVIKWEYETSDKNLMPQNDDNGKQIDFEEAIEELTFDNNLSYLIQVVTGLGLKEWVFYTKNKEDFMIKFNKCLEGQSKYPVKIEFYDDPEWKIWLEFIDVYNRSNRGVIKRFLDLITLKRNRQ